MISRDVRDRMMMKAFYIGQVYEKIGQGKRWLLTQFQETPIQVKLKEIE